MIGETVFTFQYGQIYYIAYTSGYTNKKFIYIPIQLDLLSNDQLDSRALTVIYIPIWLDLLSRISIFLRQERL